MRRGPIEEAAVNALNDIAEILCFNAAAGWQLIFYLFCVKTGALVSTYPATLVAPYCTNTKVQ